MVPKTYTHAIIKALEQSGKRDRLKLVEEQGSTEYIKRDCELYLLEQNNNSSYYDPDVREVWFKFVLSFNIIS
jgi:hypothetical protein